MTFLVSWCCLGDGCVTVFLGVVELFGFLGVVGVFGCMTVFLGVVGVFGCVTGCAQPAQISEYLLPFLHTGIAQTSRE